MAMRDGNKTEAAAAPSEPERAGSGARAAARCRGHVIATGERCTHTPHRCAGCGRVGCNRPERQACTEQQFAFLTCVTCERFAEFLPPE